MASGTYKGKDNRMIRKAGKVLVSIINRDQLLYNVLNNGKRTTQLSNHEYILDRNNTPGGLLYAANQVLAQLLADVYSPSSVPVDVTPEQVFGPNPIKIVRS